MELLGHLKVIVLLGISLVKFDRIKQDRIFKRKLSRPKKHQTYRTCFPDRKIVPVCMFLLEGTEGTDHRVCSKKGVHNGCRLRSCVRSAAHELCLTPKLQT